MNGTKLSIDDPRIDPLNPSCFSNRSGMFCSFLSSTTISFSDNRTAWQYGSTGSLKSSATILAGSLVPNQTYEFVVRMVNKQNPIVQGTGTVLVRVQETISPMIAIG